MVGIGKGQRTNEAKFMKKEDGMVEWQQGGTHIPQQAKGEAT